MKKVITTIITAISFGLIAGLVIVSVNIFAEKTGLLKNNSISSMIENQSTENIIETTASLKSSNRSYQIAPSNNSSLPTLIEDVMPTVVSITNMQKFKQNGYSMFGFRVQPQEYEAPASGSGVIVGMTDQQIIILTNNHVIQDSSGLSVTFNGEYDDGVKNTVDANIKGTDSSKDLAIISVSKKDIDDAVLKNIKVSKIGDSDIVKVGESVVAIGNALGIGQSVTSGIVSAKDREVDGIENSSKLIQIDAAINPGNSGGALINMSGELIGINVAKSSGTAIEGMGYAIPINTASDVIETMSKRKDREEIPEAEQGQLGIVAKNIDSQTASSLDMPEGIYIYKISEDSALLSSELKEKDIIVSFDEQSVKTISELQELLKYTRAGQEVKIKVKRLDGGSYVEKEFTVKLGKKKVEETQQNTQNQADKKSQNQDGNNGEYYDPFSDFEDIFRGFGQ